MAKPLLPDDLWEIIEPLLPSWTPSPKGGQPPVTDRRVLTGILFVLKTGLPWEDLPCEMNCGCGMTCWRRLRDWQLDGTWLKIHKVLLDRLRGAGLPHYILRYSLQYLLHITVVPSRLEAFRHITSLPWGSPQQ